MNLLKNFKTKNSTFVTIGPFIGTFCVAITFHEATFLRDPQNFLQGLITPAIVLPMILALILITPFGYFFGFIPAALTQLLFERFFKAKIVAATFFKALFFGCILSLMWAPLIFILAIATLQPLKFFIYAQFILIFPSTLICTLLEWQKLKQK